MDFDTLEADIPHLTTQLRAQAELVDQQLSDGRSYCLGDTPGLADIHAYFPVWMVRGNVPTAGAILAPYSRLAAWEDRMRAIGHGSRTPIDAAEAHRIARNAVPAQSAGVDPRDALGLAAGERVLVAPDDYGRDPMVGSLVTLSVHEVAIRRDSAEAGSVVVHFPRIGYRIAPVTGR